MCGLLAQPAAAQGKSGGNAFGHAKATASAGATAAASSGTDSGTAGPRPEATGVRNFGSWLDDAAVLSPGDGLLSLSSGYWRLPSVTEVDVPSFDVAFGLSKRVQAGMSVPVYHASVPGGPVVRGLGDLYLNSKIQLRDPAAGFGVAVVPLLQILSAEPVPGGGRVSWALPVSLELQRPGFRVYGSTGYFSRGSLFASAALEVPVADRVWVTGTLSQSHSVKDDAEAEALGLSSNRTDVSGGVTWAASDGLAIFGSLGRTLSTTDPNRTRVFLMGGVSIGWHVNNP
jgi:hypothetical protein